MKYYYGLVMAEREDGSRYTSEINFLVKRHKTKDGKWEYKIKIGYDESLEDVNNTPVRFTSESDWGDAIHHIFEKKIGRVIGAKLEFLTQVVL